MGVALGPVAEDGNGLALEEGQVGVVVVDHSCEFHRPVMLFGEAPAQDLSGCVPGDLIEFADPLRSLVAGEPLLQVSLEGGRVTHYDDKGVDRLAPLFV